MSRKERRGFDRIEYDAGNRPLFVSGGATFEVADCAERGLRFLPVPLPHEPQRLPNVGSEVRGTVRFPGGRDVPVEGVVVRASDEGVAVHFTQLWIDKEVIESERRRLRGPGRRAR